MKQQKSQSRKSLELAMCVKVLDLPHSQTTDEWLKERYNKEMEEMTDGELTSILDVIERSGNDRGDSL